MARMLTRPIIIQKSAMHAAIDSWRGQDDTARVLAEITEQADQIRTLTTKDFVRHVYRLLLVGKPDFAHRLVDALGDEEPRVFAIPLLLALQWGLRALPVAALVLLTLWFLL